jgi:putative flippase GtrA
VAITFVKIIADVVLFVVSYWVQKKFVFKSR